MHRSWIMLMASADRSRSSILRGPGRLADRTPAPWLLQSHEMIKVLGGFLLVLIGVELLDTIKAYFRENAIHVEIVVLLAIIAIARKVILLDPTGMSGYRVSGSN